MKIKKLDSRGFSHDLLIVAFVFIFAIAGVAYMVASHADDCGAVSGATSAATSSTASGSNCPTSGAVSSTNPVTAGSCTITDVSANPSYGQQLTPTVVYKNTGNQSFTTSSQAYMQNMGDQNAAGAKTIGSIKTVSLSAGQTATVAADLHYTVAYSSAAARTVVFTITNTNPGFTCSATATLPAAPSTSPTVPTPAPAPAPSRLAGSCRIYAVPAKPANRQPIRPYVTVLNTGTGNFQPKITERIQVGSRTVTAKSFTLNTIRPGKAVTRTLDSYTTQRRNNQVSQGTYVVTSTQPKFSCSAAFRLP